MTELIVAVQLFVSVIIGAYFYSQLKGKRASKAGLDGESKSQLARLARMRSISLTEPLSERTRPKSFDEIIGQQEGITALTAALCGENPQHVLIYGPPGVGKTCAARLVMEKAKSNPHSPFRPDAKFIEMDATCLRCDERNIADPLIGSVHDPIYQGAGAYGPAGVPSPKEGAVTRAHGGILFLDEIGELHPLHLNKLLKVMEDRKVFLESAYYSRENKNIPAHVHNVFAHGLPADFRLVGATTKSPRDIPQAIRSRCMEVYFRALFPEEIVRIAKNAALKTGLLIRDEAAAMIGEYAQSGRDAVNMVQLAAGIAREKGEDTLNLAHIVWVVETGRYAKRPALRLGPVAPGCVNGLGVYGSMTGTIIEIETVAIRAVSGSLTVTGLVEEEETQMDSRKYRRKSTAKSSVENVLTALKKNFGINCAAYDVHVNLPGGAPVDGPSAGLAIAISVLSAISGRAVNPGIAMTGEITISGGVRAVGGIKAKVEAARRAGASLAIIPFDNMAEVQGIEGIAVEGVTHLKEAIRCAFTKKSADELAEAEVRIATGQNDQTILTG
jgi:Lon-like ATP-dependent protease